MDCKDLKDEVLKVLPDLDQETANSISEFLFSNGLKSKARLHLVTVEDLTEYMNLFDARQLVESWKIQTGTGQEQAAPVQQPLTERNADVPRAQARDRDWDFDIDWSDIYKIAKGLKQKLVAGKKLNSRERREIVKRLVRQVKDRVPNASRPVFVQVAADLRRKYKVTFVSELADGKINKKSMCYKMQAKFDNDKRAKNRMSVLEMEAPPIKAAYGCTKWRLTSLPPHETAETQERHRSELQDHYEDTRPEAWQMDVVEEKMEITYGTLRKEINTQAEEIMKANKKKRRKNNRQTEEAVDDPITTTEELRNRWPFLFLPDGMMSHFLKLTGVDFKEKLNEFLATDVDKILEFLFETTKGKTKKIRKRTEKARKSTPTSKVPELLALLLLLLKRFDEKATDLWQIVDGHLREEDIAEQCQVPKTPCLFIVGGDNVFEAGIIYFSMDGNVLGTAQDMKEGIEILFCSYFNFNLMYAANAQITLEFVQRCIALICPPRGNKRPPKTAGGHANSKIIHGSLRKLTDHYDAFFAEKDGDEESESDSSS